VDTSAQLPDSLNTFDRLLAGEPLPLYERLFRCKDGSLVPVEINAELVRDAQGNPLHIQSVVRDITERKKAEAATLQFSQMLKDLNEVTMQISLAPSFDEMCRLAIELGRDKLGFDRLGLWFLEPERPNYAAGSFGVDEAGHIRDERELHICAYPDECNEKLTAERMYIFYGENMPTYNENHKQVGESDRAAVALWDGNTVIGFLYVDNLLTHKPIAERQRELLMLFGQAIGHQGTLKRAQQHLEQLAIRDELTGISNRRHFFNEAEKVFVRSRAQHNDLIALMMDIDHFKDINDTYGHQTGDIVLHEVAWRLHHNLRPTDLLGRYGGEEFVALLPRFQQENLGQIGDRLLQAINEKPCEANHFSVRVTLSMGIALYTDNITSLDDLLAQADRALYNAKQAGRNRWAFADAEHTGDSH
jgi:diguanylate cyclase (GGDEF)-like protein